MNALPDLRRSAAERRARLQNAATMLIFTPQGPAPDPEHPATAAGLTAVSACLGAVDAIQVRVKAPERRSGPSPAAPLRDWTRHVLGLCAGLPAERRPLVFVNDRVDVARLLAPEGIDGVHLGQDDLPPQLAREQLGPNLLIGLSTRGARQLLAAEDAPVDYLGFGPVFASRTKGYERGLGPEAAWAAASASGRPVFPIGGIDLHNALELAQVGRAAVGAALLEAEDPARAAVELAALLRGD